MRTIKFLMLALGFITLITASPGVSAQGVLDPICQQNPEATACQENDQTRGDDAGNNKIYGPNGIITKAVRILSFIIGIAAVIMIIVGGIRYVTSSGDPNSVNGAKNTIIYAIIGLVIAVFAQAIIIFVINRL